MRDMGAPQLLIKERFNKAMTMREMYILSNNLPVNNGTTNNERDWMFLGLPAIRNFELWEGSLL